MKFFFLNWVLICLLFASLPAGFVNISDWHLWVAMFLVAAINVSGYAEGKLE